LIEVNPRHVRYYQSMLGFEVVGGERHNSRVSAPAILLSLDLSHAREQIRLFGGKPELSVTERSAYPHFFSSQDEAGIVGRLQRADEDVAHVFDRGPERSPVQARSRGNRQNGSYGLEQFSRLDLDRRLVPAFA
jgi:hypothetical protein